MSRRHFLFVIGARALPPKMAVVSKFASPSAALGTLRAAINDQDSKPIEITQDQWKFLRGVYAINPEAPCGLPYGTTPFWRKTAQLRRSVVFHGRRQAVRTDARSARIALAHGASRVDTRVGFEYARLHCSATASLRRFDAFGAERLASTRSGRRRRQFSLHSCSPSWPFSGSKGSESMTCSVSCSTRSRRAGSPEISQQTPSRTEMPTRS